MKLSRIACMAPATLALALALTSLSSHAVPAWVQADRAAKGDCPTAVERMLNFTKDGVVHKGEVVGDRLMIVGKDGKAAPAADGIYKMANGQQVVVKDGKIAHGAGGGGGAGKV